MSGNPAGRTAVPGADPDEYRKGGEKKNSCKFRFFAGVFEGQNLKREARFSSIRIV
jgi:hypothetical protein